MIFERIGHIFAPASKPEEKQEVRGQSMVGFRRAPDQIEWSRRGFLGMLAVAALAEPVHAIGADILANGTITRTYFSDGSSRDERLVDRFVSTSYEYTVNRAGFYTFKGLPDGGRLLFPLRLPNPDRPRTHPFPFTEFPWVPK